MKTDMEGCPLGMPYTTLAAWHDATLDGEEARRVADHIRTCEACRNRLADYDQIDRAIRQQSVPQAAASPLWQEIHAGMSANRRMRRHQTNIPGAQRRRRLLGSIGALAAAILVVAAFLRLFQSHAGLQAHLTPTAPATVTLHTTPVALPTVGPSALPVPGAPLSWHAYREPVPWSDGSTNQVLNQGLAISSSDGETAYMCDPVSASGRPGTRQSQIWVTHDLGSEWSHVGNLPALGSINSCALEVDTIDGNRLIVEVEGQLPTETGYADWFLSVDGGVTWSMIASGSGQSDQYVDIEHIATAQGKTYALYTTYSPGPIGVPTPTTAPGQSGAATTETSTHLSVSADGLRTWRPVDLPIIVDSTQQVQQFWAQVGANGAMSLLADVGGGASPDGSYQADTLWTSSDGGAHWTQILTPAQYNFIAQAIAGESSWYICGGSSSDNQNPATVCSVNGGKTWIQRPLLWTCSSCAAQSPVPPTAADGFSNSYIAGDGSLVMLLPYQLQQVSAIYRLPANSSRWQYLGTIPMSSEDSSLYASFIYTPSYATPGDGYLWVYSGAAAGNDLSAFYGGVEVSPPGGAGIISGDMFYTAAYAS